MLTRDKVMISMPPKMSDAARRKSKEMGVSVSFVIQRAIAKWIATGEIADVDPLTWASMAGAELKDNAPKAKRVSKPKK